MSRGGSARLPNAGENELTVRFTVASLNGFKSKKGVIGDSKYRQFLKVVLLLREVEK